MLDKDGNEAGSTYPKRAAGLVKKGRACYMNDFTIRLNMSDAIQNSEVIKMDNINNIETSREQAENKIIKLYFDPRRWAFNKDCSQNTGSRSFMQGPDGEIAEAYMIGDWDYNWTEIVSEILLLPKNTNFIFTFWLNGGENDEHDEVCRFEVLLDHDYEQRYTYNLNRNYIKPVRKLNGWKLYEIPFRTMDNEYTQLRFVAQRACMTVMPAKDSREYDHIQDTPDPFEAERPQRHNLIFADGFPKNSGYWYSTEQPRGKYESFEIAANNRIQSSADKQELQMQVDEIRRNMEAVTRACKEIEAFDVAGLIERMRYELKDVFGDGEEDPDLDEIVCDAVGRVQNVLTDAVDDIRDALEEVFGQMEELNDALLDEE